MNPGQEADEYFSSIDVDVISTVRTTEPPHANTVHGVGFPAEGSVLTRGVGCRRAMR